MHKSYNIAVIYCVVYSETVDLNVNSMVHVPHLWVNILLVWAYYIKLNKNHLLSAYDLCTSKTCKVFYYAVVIFDKCSF